MSHPNIVRTDSSLWADIDAKSQLSVLEMVELCRKEKFALDAETINQLRTNPSFISTVNAGEVKVNESVTKILYADKPKGLADLMKGNITVR